MRTIDLDHHAVPVWQQQKKVHTLPVEAFAFSELRDRYGVVVEINLRNQRRKRRAELGLEEREIVLEQAALAVRLQ